MTEFEKNPITLQIIGQIDEEIEDIRKCIDMNYLEMESSTNQADTLEKESWITFWKGRRSALEWVQGLLKNETVKGGTYR